MSSGINDPTDAANPRMIAMPRPIPPLPPVTTATRPVRSNMVIRYLRQDPRDLRHMMALLKALWKLRPPGEPEAPAARLVRRWREKRLLARLEREWPGGLVLHRTGDLVHVPSPLDARGRHALLHPPHVHPAVLGLIEAGSFVIDDHHLADVSPTNVLLRSFIDASRINFVVTARARPTWATPRRLLYRDHPPPRSAAAGLFHPAAVLCHVDRGELGTAAARSVLTNVPCVVLRRQSGASLLRSGGSRYRSSGCSAAGRSPGMRMIGMPVWVFSCISWNARGTSSNA